MYHIPLIAGVTGSLNRRGRAKTPLDGTLDVKYSRIEQRGFGAVPLLDQKFDFRYTRGRFSGSLSQPDRQSRRDIAPRLLSHLSSRQFLEDDPVDDFAVVDTGHDRFDSARAEPLVVERPPSRLSSQAPRPSRPRRRGSHQPRCRRCGETGSTARRRVAERRDALCSSP